MKVVTNIKAGQSPTAQGLGDTVAQFTHATGIDKLAEAYTQATGKDCGCAARQEKLNQMFPYV
jgi:hypothetical protein